MEPTSLEDQTKLLVYNNNNNNNNNNNIYIASISLTVLGALQKMY